MTIKTYTKTDVLVSEQPIPIDDVRILVDDLANTMTTSLGDISDDISDIGDSVKDLEDFVGKTVTLEISPETLTKTVAECTAGDSYYVTVTAKAGDNVLDYCDFTLGATITDTITDSDTTPEIDTSTPKMENGVATIQVTLPAGTYVADETVTVTINNFTAPDGRTLTGGTSVLTIVEEEEEEG